MKDFIKTMKALTDPTRIRILKLLQQKPCCVCEIHAVLELAQPTISRHLKILEDCGLAGSSRDGLWINYTLENHPPNPYASAMLEQLRSWFNNDPEIVTLLRKSADTHRCSISNRKNNPGAEA